MAMGGGDHSPRNISSDLDHVLRMESTPVAAKGGGKRQNPSGEAGYVGMSPRVPLNLENKENKERRFSFKGVEVEPQAGFYICLITITYYPAFLPLGRKRLQVISL